MRYQLGSALLILTSLCGLRVGARAETHREVTVNIPYEFVAGGRTLPAGTYTISRLSDDRLTGLSIVSYEQRSGVLVSTNQFENRPGNDAKVSLERVGDMYYLSSIETLDGVYTVSLPRSISVLARSKHAPAHQLPGCHEVGAHISYLVASRALPRPATSAGCIFLQVQSTIREAEKWDVQ